MRIVTRENSYFADCLTGGEGSLPRSENGSWVEDMGKTDPPKPVRVSSEWHLLSSVWLNPWPDAEEPERSEEWALLK